MSRWEHRVRSELIAAQAQDTLALRNTLPGLLVSIADALDPRGRGLRLLEESGIVREHGGQRSSLPHYYIEHIVHEYRILQEEVFSVLEEGGQLIDVESRKRLQNCILRAVGDSVTEFTRIQQDIKTQFILTLTHDLRGPLTASRASAELISRLPRKSDRHVALACRVIENIDRIDQMVQNLLDGSRIQVGERIELEITEFSLRELVLDCVAELTSVYGARFKVSFEDGGLKGFWSEDGLRRVIENLGTNAVKYGDKESPILIGINHSGNEVTLMVHNDGEPISADDMATLFDPFRRAKNASRTGGKGWGLGLTLVRGVAEAHGGRVFVESAAGEGTVFKLILPRDARPFQNQERAL